ncbi:MAG: hypothetical protein B6A08_04195 [Sorangiineae bacterium NIC37A_2]|nr:MAG: hypothetical protein B6A08_04195 [Sorangiineae bacterium NIC37A_2]
MGGSWREFRLNEVYDFRSGLSKPRSAFGAGYGFLTFKDVFYSTFTPDRLGDLVDSTDRERDLCSIRRGDVFLTRTSETQDELGMSCVALRDYEAATFNGFCKRLRPKDGAEIVPEYAAYFFRGPAFRRAVTAMSSLSTRASLNEEMLERLTIVLPPRETQTAIGSILKTLDDKIELNRKMNATLEAMARALFKSWFVDFDPVRAKAEGRAPSGMDAETAKLFPSEFVDSELGPIPKGWSVASIGDLAEIVGGSTPSTKEPAYWDDGVHHWATPKDLSALATPVVATTERKITDEGLRQISSGLLPVGTVLLSSRAPIGYLGIAEVPLAVNQGFIAMKPQPGISAQFLLRWAEAAHEEIVSRANGSTFLEISKSNFRPIQLVHPSAPVLDAFHALADGLYRRVVTNEQQSRSLARTRDELLPRLLSGEVSVAHAEREVGAVA